SIERPAVYQHCTCRIRRISGDHFMINPFNRGSPQEVEPMIEKPQITELPAAATAYIHLEIPRAQMPEVFGPAVEELVSTITGQGAAIAGPLFAHHLRMEPETFEFEIGFPVSGEVTASGRVQPGARPAVKVARTVYQ